MEGIVDRVLSDHFPLWVQITADIGNKRLNQIVQDSKKIL
jgi:hypothetical protein